MAQSTCGYASPTVQSAGQLVVRVSALLALLKASRRDAACEQRLIVSHYPGLGQAEHCAITAPYVAIHICVLWALVTASARASGNVCTCDVQLASIDAVPMCIDEVDD